MSKYAEYSTSLTDPKHIVSALESLGFIVECYDTPQPLKGYEGQTGDAQIIVRKDSIHNQCGYAFGDLGFTRTATGQYQATIDDTDLYSLNRSANGNWLGALKQSYTERRQMALAKQKGYVFQGRKVVQTDKGPTVQLVFAKR